MTASKSLFFNSVELKVKISQGREIHPVFDGSPRVSLQGHQPDSAAQRGCHNLEKLQSHVRQQILTNARN